MHVSTYACKQNIQAVCVCQEEEGAGSRDLSHPDSYGTLTSSILMNLTLHLTACTLPYFNLLQDFYFGERDQFMQCYPQGYHRIDKQVRACSTPPTVYSVRYHSNG